jgi:ligand-binding sensor domain-containing protein/signal transduction histidine kinase
MNHEVNMMTERIYCGMILLLLLVPSTFTSGQAHNTHLKFSTPISDSRLRRSTVEVILQDHLDYMWFGTRNGLYQFDAYEVTQFLPDPDAPPDSPLADDIRIQDLHEDDQNQLWIGTNRGVLVLDPERNLKTHFKSTELPTSLTSDEISEIEQDQFGRIWIGTGNGLNLFHPETQSFERFKSQDELDGDLPSNQITGLVKSTSGDLWVSSTSPGMITRISGENPTFKRFHEHPDSVLCLLSHSDGTIWFGTWGNGLFSLDPESQEISQYHPSEGKITHLSSDIIVSLFEYNDGSLWIGTFDKGLNRFNPQSGKVQVERHDPDIRGSLNFDSIYAMRRDRTGSVWLGLQQEGINRFTQQESLFRELERDRNDRNQPAPTAVTTLVEDTNGNLWMGSQFSGLRQYDPVTERYDNPDMKGKEGELLQTSSVRSLLSEDDGSLWIGTFRNGFFHWDQKNDSLISYPILKNEAEQTNGETVFAITRDSKNQIWIGYERFGMERLTPSTGERKHFPMYIDPIRPHRQDSVWPIFSDSKGTLWVSTHYGGVKRKRASSSTLETIMAPILDPDQTASPAINSFAESSSGDIWAASRKGLFRWRDGNPTPKRFSKDTGLPTESISSIIYSKSNHIWAATDIGILQIDPETGKNTSFLQGKDMSYIGFHRNAVLNSKNGQVYFGGNNGIVHFDPNLTHPTSLPPSIRLRGIRIEDGNWQEHHAATHTPLVLQYPNNSLGFRFAALSFSHTALNQYAYMLEGLDDSWTFSGQQREAFFSSIPAGNYKLKAKASNHDGFWSEPETILSLKIQPPYWQTSWFRTLSALALAALLVSIHYLRINSIHKRKEALEQMILDRTEGLKQLNQNQARFFSLVAHDIQKPIAGVQPFAKLLADRGDLLTKKETANIAEEWYQEMTTLNRFLKDILSWSMGQMQSSSCLTAPFSLFDNANTVIKELAIVAKRNQIELKNLVSESTYVLADPKMISTVFRNLISNAITHTRARGLVSIEAQVHPSEVIISVKDSGIGMTQEFADHLFDNSSGTPHQDPSHADTTGLGLHLCKHFIDLNGGTIQVKTELGAGSTFSFTLAPSDSDSRSTLSLS